MNPPLETNFYQLRKTRKNMYKGKIRGEKKKEKKNELPTDVVQTLFSSGVSVSW